MSKADKIVETINRYACLTKQIKSMQTAREIFNKQSEQYLKDIRRLNLQRVHLIRQAKNNIDGDIENFLRKVV